MIGQQKYKIQNLIFRIYLEIELKISIILIINFKHKKLNKNLSIN